MTRTRFLVLASVLLVGILASLTMGRLGHPFTAAGFRPLKVPFRDFPRSVGAWSSEDRPLTPGEIQTAGMDHYLRREYRGTGSDAVLFYMCYYGNKDRGLETIFHNPTVCLPAAGWKAVKSGRKTITLTDVARQFEVSLDRFEAEGRRLVILNFFILDGEILEQAPRNKPFRLALEKLKPSSDPGFFAQIQVVANAGQDPEQAEKAAVRFLTEAGVHIFRHF